MPAQRYQIRPLGPWLEAVTQDRPRDRFRAAWSDTLDLIGRETAHLDAKLVVIQIDVSEGDLRLDGMLRANAKVGLPGVRVSFESRHGSLTYATDAYAHWQANVRAVALTLQGLRKVDEFGLRRAAQYEGFNALGRLQRTPRGAVAIPLKDRERRVVAHALIDQADAHLADKPWYRLASGYVVRTEVHGGRKSMVYLHRAVHGLGSLVDDPVQVDHIDGNGLDNRRSNLRLASPSENGQNRDGNRNRRLPRGVHFRPERGLYLALAKLAGVRHEVGYFPTPAEAQLAISSWRAANMPYSKDHRASRKHHPDLPGGNADFFRLLVEARDLLNKEN